MSLDYLAGLTKNNLIYQICLWMMPAMRALIGSTSMETSIHFEIKRLSNTDLYFKEKLLQAFL